MKVKDVLASKGSKVCFVQTNDTIKHAVSTLIQEKIGALLVYDDDKDIVGILTERDIMRAFHEYGKKLEETLVNKVMTRRVIIGTPDDDLEYIMNIMTHNRIRHVPIVENEQLQGIISIGDVVKAQLHDSRAQIKYLQDFLHHGHHT